MVERIVHSFEAGRRGKPDELDSIIANRIGAYFLDVNRDARFDLRVRGGYSTTEQKLEVGLSGEVSESLLSKKGLYDDLRQLVVKTYNSIHRTDLASSDFVFNFGFKPQASPLATNGFAGDSGNPIAVAYRKGPHFLPWERYLAVGIRDLLDEIFIAGGQVPSVLANESGIKQIVGFRADGKVGVDAVYRGADFLGLEQITIAAEHEPTLPVDELRNQFQRVLETYLGKLARFSIDDQLVDSDFSFGKPNVTINGLGDWNRGGWRTDEGTREAKPYRDGFASHGVNEDSFSGEDPSKPSATGTFLARYIAAQIVASHLADYARVQLRYTIGSEDVGLNITTQDTAKVSQDELEKLVREKMPLKISDAITRFGLKNPEVYRKIAAEADFFQNPEFPWNQYNLALGPELNRPGGIYRESDIGGKGQNFNELG